MSIYNNPSTEEGFVTPQDDEKKKKKKLDWKPIGYEDDQGQEVKPEQKQIEFKALGYENDEGNAVQPVPQKQVSRKTGTRQKMGQPMSFEQAQEAYNRAVPDSEEFNQIDNQFKKSLPPRDYERVSGKRRGTWTDEQEKKYNEEGYQEYLKESKRLRDLKEQGVVLEGDDLKSEEAINRYREGIRKGAAERTEQFAQGQAGKRPVEGLVGQERSVVRLNQNDVDTRATMPEANKNGDITGFSGQALFDTGNFKGLKGDQLREAGVRKYTGMLGFNDEEQTAIVETAKLLGQPLWKHFDEKGTPVESIEDFVDRGEILPEGDKNFVQFTDKDVTFSKLGLLARIAKAETGSADPQKVKEMFDRLKSIEDEEDKKDDESNKALKEEEGTLGRTLNGLINSVASFFFEEGEVSQADYVKKILGAEGERSFTLGNPETNPENVIEFKNQETEKAVTQLLAVRNYQRNTKYQQAFLEASRRPEGSAFILANPMMYAAAKALIPNFENYVPTPEKTGAAVGAMAPALIPYVGLPYSLAQMESQLRDSDPSSYNTMLFTGVATMGLGRLANLVRPQIGSAAVGTIQTGLGGVQTGVNYAVNWEAYKNKDGSTNWGNLMQDLFVDIAQSGLDVGETVQGVKNMRKASREPNEMLNMVVKNAETGEYAMFVKNPDSGVLEMRTIDEGKVHVWRDKQIAEKRQFIEQTIDKKAWDTAIVKHGKEGVVEAFNNLLFGTPNVTRDRAEMLAKSKRADVKSDIGKIAFDAEGEASPAKSGYYVGQKMAEQSQGYSALKLLDDYKAPLNIHTNLLTPESVEVVKALATEGLVNIDQNGQVKITGKGSLELGKIATASENFSKMVDDVSSLYGTGTNFKIPTAEKEGTGKSTGKEIMGSIALPPKRTINTGIREIMTMGEEDRRKLAVEIARGNATFDPETGTVRNTDFIEAYPPKRFNFGKDGEAQANTFKMGRDIAEGRTKVSVTDSKETIALKKAAKARFEELTGLEGDEIDVAKYDAEQEALKTAEKGPVLKNTTAVELPKPSIFQRQSNIKREISDFSFDTLKEGEKLPAHSTITVKDASGRIVTFHKDKYGLYKSGEAESSIPRSALEKQIREGKYSLGRIKAPELRIATSRLNRDQQKAMRLLDPKTVDNYLLPKETHQSNYVAYSNKGILEPDAGTRLDLSEDRWSQTADSSFEQSGADPTRFYMNDRMVTAVRQLEKGLALNLPEVDGLTYSNYSIEKIANRIANLDAPQYSKIKERLTPEEITELNRLKEILDKTTDPIDLLRVSNQEGRRPDYFDFIGASAHEATHKHLLKVAGGPLLFKDSSILPNILSTGHGQRLTMLMKEGPYRNLINEDGTPREGLEDFIAHEVLAFGTDADQFSKLGVQTEDEINDYARVYVDVLSALSDEYGAKSTETVLRYADPEFKELLAQVIQNYDSRLQSSSRGPEGPRGTGSGGFASASRQPDEGLARGSGLKRLSLRRFTPTGNPFDLTGIHGAEHAGRVRDQAEPTLNFYVRKPDGTYSFEPQFKNTKLISFDDTNEWNLVDINEDVTARAVLMNRPFPEFQKWAESRGYEGFFNSFDDVADAFRYRVGLFYNEDLRKKLKPAPEFAMYSKGKDQENQALHGDKPSETFYSEVVRAVESAKLPNKAKGEQYLNILKNSRGVKKDELEWSGLNAMLSEDRTFTKEEVIRAANENRVQINEVRFGAYTDAEKAKIKDQEQRHQELTDRRINITREITDFAKLVSTSGDKTQDEKVFAIIDRDRDVDNLIKILKAVSNAENPKIGGGLTKEQMLAKADELDKKLSSVRGEINKLREEMDKGRPASKAKWADYGNGNLVTKGDRYDDVEIVIGIPRLVRGETGGPKGGVPKGWKQVWDGESSYFGGGGRYVYENENGERVNWTAGRTPEESDLHLNRNLITRQRETAPTYESSHWDGDYDMDGDVDAQNPVVHIRGNGRTAVDGKKTFLVDEIQSDLHQEGREIGYNNAGTVAKKKEISEKIETTEKELKKLNDTIRMDSMVENTMPDDELEALSQKRYAKEKEVNALRRELNELKNAIPEAPFADTWHELAFKRALRWAVENGFDRIAWTTGRQQIDRNETALRQNVDRIAYTKITDESFKELSKNYNKLLEDAEQARMKMKEVSDRLSKEFDEKHADKVDKSRGSGFVETAKSKFIEDDHDFQLAKSDWIAKNKAEQDARNITDEIRKKVVDLNSDTIPETVMVTTYKDGKKTATHFIPETGETQISGRRVSLDGLLGKKMADEIREKGEGSFEGEGLAIGGGMHRLLYDTKLPSFVNKYVKQWGGKVSTTELVTEEHLTDIHYSVVEKDGKFLVKQTNSGEVMGSFSSRSEATTEMLRLFNVKEQTKETFYSVDITPEMRKSVMAGQPLFQLPRQEKQATTMRSYYTTSPKKANVQQMQSIIKEGNFSAIASDDMEGLKKDLDSMGYYYVPAEGVYKGVPEDSLIVYYPDGQTSRVIQYLANKHNQESALHGQGGKYWLEFNDGSRMESGLVKFSKKKSTKDGTYIELGDESLGFNMNFDESPTLPAPQGYSLKPAETKFVTRQKYKDTSILTPEDIRRNYEDGFVVGEDGMMLDTDKKRDIIGSIGLWQQLVRDMNPNMEPLVKPAKDASPEEKEIYNVKRAERYLAHIKSMLYQYSLTDPDAFGAKWYTEKPREFAEKVGRDVKDVNNDVVKLWLWLSTAATSQNTPVKSNAQFAQNAIASIVRFYESGKLTIPRFQYDNQGNLVMKEDGSPKRLGLGSSQMEKVQVLMDGWVPADSAEGWAAFDLGAEVKRARDLMDNPTNPNDAYIFSQTAKSMMDKYGPLQGVINFLISPSVGNKFNKAVDIFGDKIGAFMSNLMGMTQIPTIDTWMQRYFLGLTGDAIRIKRDKHGNATKVEDMSQRFDPNEGDFWRGVIQKATEDWNKESDHKLTPADVQAIIWTQVKDLFNTFVKTETDNIDFSEAYDQIRGQMTQAGLFEDFHRNKQMPSAEHNPALIADAKKKAPNVKALTDGNYADDYGARHFIESRNGVEFAMASRDENAKKVEDIENSQERLDAGDFDAWIDLASSLVNNGLLSDGEVEKIHSMSYQGTNGKPDIDGLQKYIMGLNKMGVLELFVDFLRVNPLIGVKNIARNLSSNQLHQIADELSRLPAFVVDIGLYELNKKITGTSERTVLAPSLISTSKAMWKGITQGVPEAASFFAKGDNSPNFEHPAMFRDRTTGWKILRPLEIYNKYGFRLQEAADRPFKVQAFYRALDEIAKIRAKEMKVSVDEAYKHLTIGDHDQAREKALYLTFQDSNRISKRYYEFRDGQSPFVRALMNLAVPYIKTPLNVVSVALDYTGFYPLIKGINNEFGHKEWIGFKEGAKRILDNPEDRKAISFGLGKGMTGWTLAYIGWKLGAGGLLTSFFDRDDKKERDEMTAKGTNFGNIIINGESYDISSLTPVSFLMLSGAAYAEAQKDAEKARANGKDPYPSIMAVSRILKNLALSTPILGTAVRMYEDNEYREKGGMPDFTSLLGLNRVTPAIVQEVAKTVDRKERVIDNSSVTQKTLDTLQSQIPIAREKLPVQYDMLGREIEAPYGVDPFKTKTVDTDELQKELDRFDLTINPDQKGTSVQRNESRKVKGEAIVPHLRTVMESEAYKQLPDEKKKELLQGTIKYASRDIKADKLAPEEEKHNINMMVEAEFFKQQMKNNPHQFATGDRTITDKKVLTKLAQLGKKDLSWDEVVQFANSHDQFIDKQFEHHLRVGKDNTLDAASKDFQEFKADPQLAAIRWYLNQIEYNERSQRLKKRKDELVKEGKTDAEIEKTLNSESAKRGWQNRKNKVDKIVVKAASKKAGLGWWNDRDKDEIEGVVDDPLPSSKMTNKEYGRAYGNLPDETKYNPKILKYGQSKNIIDRRKGSEYDKIASVLMFGSEQGEDASASEFASAITNLDPTKLTPVERDELRKFAIKEMEDLMGDEIGDEEYLYRKLKELIRKLK